MIYSDLELAQLHVATLFVHDSRGGLLRVNEPDPDAPVPRFFLARTRAGNLWRTRYDLPDYLAAELERLATGEPVGGDLDTPPYHVAEYTALLQQHAPLHNTDAGPAYSLPERDPPTGTVTITPANETLLQVHYSYTLSRRAERAPVVVHVADEVAVAVCFSARITAQAAEAGVHTVEIYRGHGYAADTVLGWAAAIRAMGRLPLYSTSWANTASQAVARKLGAVQYAGTFSVT